MTRLLVSRAAGTPGRIALCAMVGAALALSAGTAQAQAPAAARAAAGQSSIKTLDRAQIDALLATPQDVLVIDVRRPDEVSTIGGFPAFLSIQNADLERSIPYVPRDRQIITVSNHAHRALQAAALLASKGFRVAGAAGAQDYEAQGGTLTGRKVAGAAAAARSAGAAPPAGAAPRPAN